MRRKGGSNAMKEELTTGLALFGNSQSFAVRSSLTPSRASNSCVLALDCPPAFPE